MDHVFVGSLMSAPVHTVRPDESITAAAVSILEHGTGSLVVVDHADRLVGILTATDFVRVAADDVDAGTETVSAYMAEEVVTTTVNSTLTAVADETIDHEFHHRPVVDDDGVGVGITSTTDLTAYVSGIVEPSPPRPVAEN